MQMHHKSFVPANSVALPTRLEVSAPPEQCRGYVAEHDAGSKYHRHNNRLSQHEPIYLCVYLLTCGILKESAIADCAAIVPPYIAPNREFPPSRFAP